MKEQRFKSQSFCEISRQVKRELVEAGYDLEWELPWLGMTAEDVRAAKKAGIEVDEIFHFWKGRTLKGLKKSFGFTDSMMNYLKRALVEIPGGVVQLKQETVERKEARSDG